MSGATSLGFLALLRKLERAASDKPRIGENGRLRDAVVRAGQDPRLAFPVADLSAMWRDVRAVPHLRVEFMGFFGPHGALPLSTTEEVARWVEGGDGAFVAFTDIFAARFIELFFRAWSDARAISQFDHPEGDRFQTYLAALAGFGTPAFRDHDQLDDLYRLPLVGLQSSRVKSPVRLRQMIRHHLRMQAEVAEHIPTWLTFEAGDRNALGAHGMLGQSLFLGARAQSVAERIDIRLHARNLDEYRSLLPGGPVHARLSGLIFWYLGKSYEVGVTVSLPANTIPPAQLGQSAELGWLAVLAPRYTKADARPVDVTTYTLSPDLPRIAA